MYEVLNNKYFILIDNILVILIGSLHLASYFLIKETKYWRTSPDSFYSSPFFDLTLSNTTCNKYNTKHIFHNWGGLKENKSYYNSEGNLISTTSIYNKTNIDRIYGYKFCYNIKTYGYLLLNDQIIRKGEKCGKKYPKDCGIIDTLQQHLCIENNENCPLYDIGIIRKNESINKEHYIYNKERNIYYNDNNYNVIDKKIIGSLILSDGQPCINEEEKLWKAFSLEEADQTHLECNEINGIKTDNRYIKVGDITYKELYKILPKESYDKLKDKIKDEYISLYKREFIGLDKECYENWETNFEKLKNNQKKMILCLYIESIEILYVGFFYFILTIFSFCCNQCDCISLNINVFAFSLLFCLVGFILQSLILERIVKYSLFYYCSDEITNEIIRMEDNNTEKIIIYTVINLVADLFYILLNIILIIKLKFPFIHKMKQKFNENKGYDYNTIRNKIDIQLPQEVIVYK